MTEEEWRTHPLALGMSEAALQANVMAMLRALDYRAYHTHDSRRSDAGFPDVCAVRARDGRLLFAELKSQKGRMRPEQRDWLGDLKIVGNENRHRVGPALGDYVSIPEVHVWRPSDWLSGDVERILL